jgi:hypothetical protein
MMIVTAFLGISSQGCSGGSGDKNIKTCLDTLIKEKDAGSDPKVVLCCQDGPDGAFTMMKSEVATSKELCQSCNPLSCNINLEDTETAAASAGGNASAAQEQLENLVSSVPGMPKTGPSSSPGDSGPPLPGQNGAATAGETVGLARQSSKKNPNLALPTLPGSGGLNQGNSGGSATAGSDGKSTPSGGTLAAASAGAPAAGMKEDASAGAYTSGGGAAGGEGGGDFRSQGRIGGGNGSVSVIELGTTSSGSEEIAVADAADYFTRIGIDESLFHVVHKRYRSTSTQWTKQSTQNR